jgi:hypothetical protein
MLVTRVESAVAMVVVVERERYHGRRQEHGSPPGWGRTTHVVSKDAQSFENLPRRRTMGAGGPRSDKSH